MFEPSSAGREGIRHAKFWGKRFVAKRQPVGPVSGSGAGPWGGCREAAGRACGPAHRLLALNCQCGEPLEGFEQGWGALI